MTPLLEAPEEPVSVTIEIFPFEIRRNGKPLSSEAAALLIRLLQCHYFPTLQFKQERSSP